MSEFGGLENEAESLAKDHPDQVDQGLEAAGQFADKKTGNKFDSEIQGGVSAAEQHLTGQGGQDQSGQDQGGQS